MCGPADGAFTPRERGATSLALLRLQVRLLPCAGIFPLQPIGLISAKLFHQLKILGKVEARRHGNHHASRLRRLWRDLEHNTPAVRDASEDKNAGDPGVKDKRLLVVEQELGAALRAFQRQGNNLSMILRKAFDGGTLEPPTKNNRIRATDPHINVVGHITRFELKELMAASEIWGGFGNRFQWVMARRPKTVAFPKPMPTQLRLFSTNGSENFTKLEKEVNDWLTVKGDSIQPVNSQTARVPSGDCRTLVPRPTLAGLKSSAAIEGHLL
jgi:hypothetical protein